MTKEILKRLHNLYNRNPDGAWDMGYNAAVKHAIKIVGEETPSELNVGDPVLVNDSGDEYEAVILQWNDDDTLVVMSEATGNENTVGKDDIRRAEKNWLD